MKRRIVFLALLLAVAACGTAQVAPENRTRTRADRLTQEEILRTEMTNMYDVIQRLQPAWLTPQRERGLPAPVGVFVDGVRAGSIEYLRQMPATQVQEARFLNNRQIGAELTSRQQTGIGSAIMLITRRG
jgi:hypothetical protein